MKIFGFNVQRSTPNAQRPTENVTPLSEAEMNAALQLPKEHPAWRTLMQLLETAIENAHALAAASIMETNRMAGYTGGAEHLAMFRDELIRRRDEGLEALRRSSHSPVLSRPGG